MPVNLTYSDLQRAGIGAFFRPRDVRSLGVTFYQLQRMVADGRVETVGPGLYRLAEVEATEMETIAMVASAVPHAIVCLLSALRIHEIGTQSPHQVWLAIDRKAGPYEVKDGNDRVVYIRRGHAAGTIAGQRKIAAGPREIINVPRNTALRLEPGAERVEAIEVTVFPIEDQKPPRFGAVKAPPDVVTTSEMDALYAKFDTEQSLYIQPHFRVAFVIRTIPSAYEAHGCCVDIYLPVHTGSAHVLLGGKIENPQERGPGEIRGSGMTGSRAADIGPGDMIVIRRAGEHYIDPRPGKVGYIIVKIQAE